MYKVSKKHHTNFYFGFDLMIESRRHIVALSTHNNNNFRQNLIFPMNDVDLDNFLKVHEDFRNGRFFDEN